ncbi:uncharacterized protein BDR25DRAFT_305255 [Lindgomyces ingoldianus]|uniref:Uncharacterized protein n=1 Tax=Lindgomyces ingoldianus TaxID=673940 RepID=A0ACB6QN38_9PLEO|nr:uncharacterized protein BDR25DRAFT_305255 [Lindgomyces ingoldianus]KAF2468287.1 hypothetical protein BDR25DRAFT_305255 [Lindgomyces ingoldianus]
MLFFQIVSVFGLVGCCLSRSLPKPISPRQNPSTTAAAPAANPTICGDIVDAVNDPEGFNIFWASDAYACLTSVPFNPAVASRFVKYWNETIQFQSTLAYLKNPPTGYQQPAFDVQAGLAVIQQHINEGFYTNQYAFEADFQLLTYAMHDAHVQLTAGALSAFSFASPYEIASVSIDGKEPPKVYMTDDIINSPKQGWTPSPLKTINGVEVVEFLTQYAALNSWGNVEPHADWNALMSHPALDIQGGLNMFAGSGTFYPGENLTFVFENTTKIETIWIAIYNELANYTGPLTTGGDFYNYFVLGELPASFNSSTIVEPEIPDAPPAPTSWFIDSLEAYPSNPDIAQSDLGVLGTGLVTGYFYNDISTGILSLPSFDIVPDSIGNYSDAVSSFIGNASQANLTRVIIDLQQNKGGATLLAYTIFKSFFPDQIPFAGSRRRSFDMANLIGSSTSNFWDSLDESNDNELTFKQEIAANEWVITDRLNAATGKNFTGWKEYQGPVDDNGDSFTLTEQYDLANDIFDSAAFDEWIPLDYLGDQSRFSKANRPWQPEQIVILTDGLCSSACSLLVEMMTRVGVRTIVAGGRPTTGPMQAVGGNRGARLYSANAIDADISFSRSIDEWVDDNVNGSLPDVRETGMFIKFAGINLRDQVRKDDKTPLQFKYEAADCRIYYTLSNLYNATRLWHDTATAAFIDPSLCVQDSTGYSTTNNTNPKAPPKPSVQSPPILTQPAIQQIEFESNPTGGLQDGAGKPKGDNTFVLCPSGVCEGTARCKTINVKCSKTLTIKKPVCLPTCDNRLGSTGCNGICDINQKHESKSGLGKTASYGGNLFSGLCVPEIGTRSLGCPANPKTGK